MRVACECKYCGHFWKTSVYIHSLDESITGSWTCEKCNSKGPIVKALNADVFGYNYQEESGNKDKRYMYKK